MNYVLSGSDAQILLSNIVVAYNKGLFTEANAQLLSYGINCYQLGNDDLTKYGAIFRMDIRAGFPYFSVRKQDIGTHSELPGWQITTAGLDKHRRTFVLNGFRRPRLANKSCR